MANKGITTWEIFYFVELNSQERFAFSHIIFRSVYFMIVYISMLCRCAYASVHHGYIKVHCKGMKFEPKVDIASNEF